ncbi:hypothetical protein PMG11_11014 [Penicillium brasilianum]|uniref:Uncharacterized protein n=1 Tax=Penicillium brasilianum TaxID=104259 RepID=A0A0F7U556_PENBI|nr:hypothetical protein PMG11_11014 [Penicillium brasilianum]
MATNHDTDTSEDDSREDSSLMAQANEQLERELLQSQKRTLATNRAPRRVVSLGISPSYVKDWVSADAFRELYQNWKDAIIERFNLDRQSFQPLLEDYSDHLSIIVPHQTLADQPAERENRRALGFIQYEKKTGRITIANPCMRLPINALAMGFSTKDVHGAHDHLVGRHGEGLKLAALVLSRDGYQVSITASGCNWRFDMHTDASVSCTVAPSQKTNSIERTDPALDMGSLRYLVGRDVAVVIGARRAKSGRPVALDAFVDWLRSTTMDIRGLTYPAGIISTPHGDLILDPQLRRQLYHNGITLTNSTIWEEALRKQEDIILPLLVDILRKNPGADAEMIGPLLKPLTARQIWQYLLRESADKEFFYSERSNDQTTNTIRDSLGKRPTRLPDTLWHMLRAHCPIRTVEEEQQELFKDAKPCVVPDTTFARTVDRALRACFALLKFTDHIQVVYVRGSAGKVDVYFDKGHGTLKIHCRWLDFACMHHRSFCRPWSPSNLAGTNAPFFCCHVVEELLVRSIASMFKAHPTSRPAEMKFMRQIGRRLRYLPHSIKLKAYPGGILVSWEDNETESFRTLGSSGPDYHVVLHDDKCANAEAGLLHDKAALPNEVMSCDCRQQFARQTHRMCLFTGLSHTSTYYATIALNEDRAFYGVPSDPGSPGAYEDVKAALQ